MTSEPLLIDDNDRYSRLRLIAWWDQEKLRRAKVMVVGAGALGNEVLKNLALLGLGHVIVVDMDKVDESNLTRSVLFRSRNRGEFKASAAAAMMTEINPDTKVTVIVGNVMTDVGLGLFRDCDVVIGCLDNREARLWVNRSCWKVTRPWVDGGIQEINGVTKVFIPPDGACYECAMTENDYRLINLRYSCPLLSRDDLQSGKVPTAPTIASIVGGLQVQEALKLIHNLPVRGGEALVFNGVANRFYNTAFQHREDCLSHETYPTPIELPLSVATTTAKALFEAVAKHFESDGAEAGTDAELSLSLDRDLVVSLDCGACGNSQPMMRPLMSVGMAHAKCPSCQQPIRPQLEHDISPNSLLADQTLAQLGVPRYDIVKVVKGDQERAFLLAGDRPSLPSGMALPSTASDLDLSGAHP